MTTRRRHRTSSDTIPAPMLRDEEVSAEISLRAPAAALNLSGRDTTVYAWGANVARSRTTTLPIGFTAYSTEG